jgi:hypothetical protein
MNAIRIKMAVALSMLLTLSGCGSKREAWYQSVTADQRWDQSQGIIKTLPADAAVPKYIVVSDKLFLNVQNVRHRLLDTSVEHPLWDEATIASLKSSDVIFLRHLPSPDEPLGGVKWLTDSISPANAQ